MSESSMSIGLDGILDRSGDIGDNDLQYRSASSEMISLWNELCKGNECPKGLEHMKSPDADRIIFMKEGYCGKSYLKDSQMQKMYRIRENHTSSNGGSLFCTVEDLEKQEILRFVQESSDGEEKVTVTYRETTKLGDVVFHKKTGYHGDSYLLFLLNSPEGKELFQVFSTFDAGGCCSSEDVHSYVLQEIYPFEVASFQHFCKSVTCGAKGRCLRENTFRVDFNESIEPLVKCLVIAAAYWRLREGFRRVKDEGS